MNKLYLLLLLPLIFTGCSSDIFLLDSNPDDLIFDTQKEFTIFGQLDTVEQDIYGSNRKITFYYDNNDTTKPIYYIINFTNSSVKNVTLIYSSDNQTITGINVEDI